MEETTLCGAHYVQVAPTVLEHGSVARIARLLIAASCANALEVLMWRAPHFRVTRMKQATSQSFKRGSVSFQNRYHRRPSLPDSPLVLASRLGTYALDTADTKLHQLKRYIDQKDVIVRCWRESSVSRFSGGLFYISVTPYQLAFEFQVTFGTIYALGYVMDFFICWLALRAIAKALKVGRKNVKADKWVPELKILILCLPWDLLLWTTDESRKWIPWVRLSRVAFAARVISRQLNRFEVESAGLSYAQARALRLVLVFSLVTHCLGCTFFLFSRLDGAEHYTKTPYADAFYSTLWPKVPHHHSPIMSPPSPPSHQVGGIC